MNGTRNKGRDRKRLSQGKAKPGRSRRPIKGHLSQGIVAVQYYRPLSNPSACHVDRTRTTKEIVTEVLEDQLKEVVPGFR